MPYSNEHAARIMNPDFFEPNSFRSKELKDGIRLILGKLKGGNGAMITQAYRFSVDSFTPEQAKKWLKDHKIKFIKFEPAENVSENNVLEHVGVLGMRWGVRRGQLARKGTMLTKGRQKALDKKELSGLKSGKGLRSAHQKKLDEKKAAVLEKRWDDVKDKPISKYMQNKKAVERGRRLGYIALGLYVFGPSLIRGGSSIAKAGISIGKTKLSDYKFNKYGGFNPKNVVNSKMWDAPFRPLTSNLLTGGT